MLTIPQYAFIAVMLTCVVSGLFIGYFIGLRETKRRLKAHQEVTDRLMGRGVTQGFSPDHDDLLDASALAGTVYPTYGGISRSSNPFTATGIRNQVGLLGGSAMQNPITYSATPSKFASIVASSGRPSRSAARKELYEALKKAMDQDEISRPL